MSKIRSFVVKLDLDLKTQRIEKDIVTCKDSIKVKCDVKNSIFSCLYNRLNIEESKKV